MPQPNTFLPPLKDIRHQFDRWYGFLGLLTYSCAPCQGTYSARYSQYYVFFHNSLDTIWQNSCVHLWLQVGNRAPSSSCLCSLLMLKWAQCASQLWLQGYTLPYRHSEVFLNLVCQLGMNCLSANANCLPQKLHWPPLGKCFSQAFVQSLYMVSMMFFQAYLKNLCVFLALFGWGNNASWILCTIVALISFIMSFAPIIKCKDVLLRIASWVDVFLDLGFVHD